MTTSRTAAPPTRRQAAEQPSLFLLRSSSVPGDTEPRAEASSRVALGPPLSRGEFVEARIRLTPRDASGNPIPRPSQGWEFLAPDALAGLPQLCRPPPPQSDTQAAAAGAIAAGGGLDSKALRPGAGLPRSATDFVLDIEWLRNGDRVASETRTVPPPPLGRRSGSVAGDMVAIAAQWQAHLEIVGRTPALVFVDAAALVI